MGKEDVPAYFGQCYIFPEGGSHNNGSVLMLGFSVRVNAFLQNFERKFGHSEFPLFIKQIPILNP
jgi:hypothetical protein